MAEAIEAAAETIRSFYENIEQLEDYKHPAVMALDLLQESANVSEVLVATIGLDGEFCLQDSGMDIDDLRQIRDMIDEFLTADAEYVN